MTLLSQMSDMLLVIGILIVGPPVRRVFPDIFGVYVSFGDSVHVNFRQPAWVNTVFVKA